MSAHSVPVPAASAWGRVPEELASLKEEQLEFLRDCGRMGQECGIRVFIVGGLVRDMLLGQPFYDVDIVGQARTVDPSHACAPDLAAYIQRQLGGSVQFHPSFGTATLNLPDGSCIDVVSARTETYSRSAALPVPTFSTIEEDVFRRDFTINSLVMSLEPERFGRLLDLVGGERDLREGTVRVLHDLSFIDDPTRMFRAVRFEQRYGFRMDAHTLELMGEALERHVDLGLSGYRLWSEVLAFLDEEDPLPSLYRASDLGLLSTLGAGFVLTPQARATLEQLSSLLKEEPWLLEQPNVHVPIVFLNALLGESPVEVCRAVLRRLSLLNEHNEGRSREALCLLPQSERLRLGEALLAQDIRPSRLCHLLQPWGDSAVVYLAARFPGRQSREHLRQYLTSWRGFSPRQVLGGRDLLAAGYPRGPEISAIMRWVRDALLDGASWNREQALEAVLREFPLGRQADNLR